jgi:hypothetical protein
VTKLLLHYCILTQCGFDVLGVLFNDETTGMLMLKCKLCNPYSYTFDLMMAGIGVTRIMGACAFPLIQFSNMIIDCFRGNLEVKSQNHTSMHIPTRMLLIGAMRYDRFGRGLRTYLMNERCLLEVNGMAVDNGMNDFDAFIASLNDVEDAPQLALGEAPVEPPALL